MLACLKTQANPEIPAAVVVGMGVLGGAWVVNGVAVVGAAVVAAHKKLQPLDACCAAAVSRECCV